MYGDVLQVNQAIETQKQLFQYLDTVASEGSGTDGPRCLLDLYRQRSEDNKLENIDSKENIEEIWPNRVTETTVILTDKY